MIVDYVEIERNDVILSYRVQGHINFKLSILTMIHVKYIQNCIVSFGVDFDGELHLDLNILLMR